jgi:hypothetical protein
VDHDDGYFDERVAARYDESSAELFDPAVVDPVVDLLVELAGRGRALELGIGTGRIALPLDDEAAARLEMRGNIAEARNLRLLRRQVQDRVEADAAGSAGARDRVVEGDGRENSARSRAAKTSA